MSKSIDLYNNAKQESFVQSFTTVKRIEDANNINIVINQETTTKEEEINDIDVLLTKEHFITPEEYYKEIKEIIAVDKQETAGYYRLNTSQFGGNDIGWFWIEDLKNWGRYYVNCTENATTNDMELYVWNGKNDWIPIPDFIINKDNKKYDLYNIKNVQNKIILELLYGGDIEHNNTDKKKNYIEKLNEEMILGKVNFKNAIVAEKGWSQSISIPAFDENRKIDESGYYYIMKDFTTAKYEQHEYAQIVHAFRLQRSIKYSINEEGTFQTKRWNSIPVKYIQLYPTGFPNIIYYNKTIRDNIKNYGDYYLEYTDAVPRTNYLAYAESNFRIGISTGAPCIWRLPTGEIALCTKFSYKGDSGVPYAYQKDNTGKYLKKIKSAYKEPTPTIDYIYKYEYLAEVSCNAMLGEDANAAAKWLNDFCASYFGTGSDKTIERDWLNTRPRTTAVNEYSNTNTISFLDTNKTFEQHNINKENSLKCSFTINRPVVTTEEKNSSDYIKKW